VVPHPGFSTGEIDVFDCGSNLLIGQTVLTTINGDGSCPCGGAIEPSFKAPQGVEGGGGGSMTSANYGTRGTVGQPATGQLSSSSFGSNIGYWHLPRSTTTGPITEPVAPKVISLDQNYPNPFNPATTIRFTLPERSHVTLRIYDVRGRLVLTLIDRDMSAGVHHETLQADGFASGVYFYRIKAGRSTQVRKLVVLK
jgi:hypothetical protein